MTWASCQSEGVATLKCFEVVFERVLGFASGFVIVILLVMFVWGGFSYLTSLGSPEKLKKAQGILKYAVIGFILFLSSYLILLTIDTLFLGGQGDILKFRIGE